MAEDSWGEIQSDCLRAIAEDAPLRSALARQHIAMTGGTGFLGSWVAAMVAALNDEYKLGITLDLYARNVSEWPQRVPQLANRLDIRVHSQDVRSSFEFSKKTTYVIHAAGIPNGRVHSSDPLRVFQTAVQGIGNALEASSGLDGLRRFVNVSSSLVAGPSQAPGPLKEGDTFPIQPGQVHSVYAESKRAAEMLAAVYRSQRRLPVSTIRPFTLTGMFQELDRPWAINNFLRDVVVGNEIRIHGDGTARRSYLYGSDAAWWTLAALVRGGDGEVYNVGSSEPVSHLELATLIASKIFPKPNLVLNAVQASKRPADDLYPDLSVTHQRLRVRQTVGLEDAVEKTLRWFRKG